MSDRTANQLSHNLCHAFWTACLITGCLRRSELVVCLAIELVDVPRLGSRDLLVETVRLAIAGLVDATHQERIEAANHLPSELQAVLRLEALPRCSFVARLLLGLSLGDCVRLFRVDATEITSALLTAVTTLSQIPTLFPLAEARRSHADSRSLVFKS